MNDAERARVREIADSMDAEIDRVCGIVLRAPGASWADDYLRHAVRGIRALAEPEPWTDAEPTEPGWYAVKVDFSYYPDDYSPTAHKACDLWNCGQWELATRYGMKVLLRSPHPIETTPPDAGKGGE